MKIAHIVHTFPPYQGGIGNTCYYQVQELVKLGHEVTVFTPKYHKESRIPEEVQRLGLYGAGENLEFRIKIKYLTPILKYGNAAFVPQIIRYLKGFDVIHLHWPFIGGTEIILIWRTLLKLIGIVRVGPCLCPCRSALVVQYQMDLVGRGIFRFIFNFYQFLFLPWVVKLVDEIIISSNDYTQHSRLKKYFQKYPNKFIEIPLGVDITKFYPQTKNQSLMKKYNLNPDSPILLFVGGLDRAHYFKGLDVLLRAMAGYRLQVTGYRLLVVGDGDMRSIYEKLSKDLGLAEKVIFAGRVSDNELPDYYNLSDVFILPSIDQSESFGLVLLEAMACAKPIIVSNLPGPRSLVKEGVHGLVVRPGDVADLSEKLKFCLDHQEQTKEWGRVARQTVEEKYSWTAVCQKINHLYHNL